MAKETNMITAELVRERFDYDPTEPFALRWKIRLPHSSAVVGDIAGYWHPSKAGSPNLIRYVDIGHQHRRIPVHRIVWLHQTGKLPPRNFGWKDGNRGDCRMENLTLAPRALSPEKAKEARKRYNVTQRSKISDSDWSVRARGYKLKFSYGMTQEDYDRMHTEQKGLCATCHQPETLVRHGKVEDLVVDHCHTTNKVRGLLCHNCNNGLGRFKDDPAVLRAAADYIEHHQEQHFSGPHP